MSNSALTSLLEESHCRVLRLREAKCHAGAQGKWATVGVVTAYGHAMTRGTTPKQYHKWTLSDLDVRESPAPGAPSRARFGLGARSPAVVALPSALAPPARRKPLPRSRGPTLTPPSSVPIERARCASAPRPHPPSNPPRLRLACAAAAGVHAHHHVLRKRARRNRARRRGAAAARAQAAQGRGLVARRARMHDRLGRAAAAHWPGRPRLPVSPPGA
eukprot:1574953-Prymnesium_polylepis.1